MPELVPELTIEVGPQQGARIRLTPGCYRAGSAVCNDIVLLDASVAATHFLLEVSAGAVRIEADEGPLSYLAIAAACPLARRHCCVASPCALPPARPGSGLIPGVPRGQ